MNSITYTTFDNVPHELRALDQWHLWELNNERRKIPRTISRSYSAKSNDPNTWASFEQTIEVLRESQSNGCQKYGLAFELGLPDAETSLVGWDFDNALTSDHQMRDWATPIWELLKNHCFAEISPSGNGFKMICKGKKPKGSRCRKNYEQGGSVEVYSHSRFWCITGTDFNTPGAEFGKDITDLIVDTCRLVGVADNPGDNAVVEESRTLSLSMPTTPSSNDWDIEGRIDAYLMNCGSSQSGSRNNDLFLIAGHLYAFGASEKLVLKKMREFNALLCSPPMSIHEVEQIVRSANRNGTARESKNNDFGSMPVDTIFGTELTTGDAKNIPLVQEELKHFVADCEIENGSNEIFIEHGDMQKDSIVPEAIWRDGGVIEWITDHVLHNRLDVYAPEMGLISALNTVQALCCLKVVDDSYRKTRCNMYTVAIGPSGVGKSTAMQFLLDVTEQVIKPSLDIHRPTMNVGSYQTVHADLQEYSTPLYMFDEIGELLKAINMRNAPAHIAGLSKLFKEVYSQGSSGRFCISATAHGTKNSPRRKYVNNPMPILFGASTEKVLTDNITNDMIEGGLMGRISIFVADPRSDFREPTGKAIPQNVRDWCTDWRNASNPTTDANLANIAGFAEPRTIKRDGNAAKRLDRHYKDIRQKSRDDNSVMSAACWNRTSEQTAKLAMLFALSQSSAKETLVLNLDHANRAIALSNFLTRRKTLLFQNSVSENEHEAKRKRVLECLPRNGKYITKNELTRKTQFLSGRRERTDIVSDLVESGQIEQRTARGSAIVFCRINKRRS